MKFKEPLTQYLFRWFREKKGEPVLGGIIFDYVPSDKTDKFKFIQTSYGGYNTHSWKTHERNGSARDNWLEEYTPTKKEKRKAIETVFILANDDGTIE